MAAVDAQVDLGRLTQELVDGLIALGTGPRATTALRTLQATATDGLRSLIRDGVTEFVASDKFDTAWAEALRIGHTQMVATLSNDPTAVATISEDGSLGIPLGPIVERVKADLVERGITVAGRIPPVDRTIVLVHSDQLPTVQVAYGITVAVGTWLPWVVVALLVGGVLVANRRPRALLWAAGGFAFVMALMAIMFAVGRIALVAAVPASVLPGSVSSLFYDTATDGMRSTAVAAAVLGLAVGRGGVAGGAVPHSDPTPRGLRERRRPAARDRRRAWPQHRIGRFLGAPKPITGLRADRRRGGAGRAADQAADDLDGGVDGVLGRRRRGGGDVGRAPQASRPAQPTRSIRRV